ncbi:glycosyltransferase family protein 64 protein C5-like [Hordeum vulgare]|nr:glycosyltransferase family protein 64 protein C5-like [Hordeum vulgare]
MEPPPLNLAGSARIHAKSAENGSTPEGKSSANGSAWPVANPVLTCASATKVGYPSNFIADPLTLPAGFGSAMSSWVAGYGVLTVYY